MCSLPLSSPMTQKIILVNEDISASTLEDLHVTGTVTHWREFPAKSCARKPAGGTEVEVYGRGGADLEQPRCTCCTGGVWQHEVCQCIGVAPWLRRGAMHLPTRDVEYTAGQQRPVPVRPPAPPGAALHLPCFIPRYSSRRSVNYAPCKSEKKIKAG